MPGLIIVWIVRHRYSVLSFFGHFWGLVVLHVCQGIRQVGAPLIPYLLSPLMGGRGLKPNKTHQTSRPSCGGAD